MLLGGRDTGKGGERIGSPKTDGNFIPVAVRIQGFPGSLSAST